MEVVITDSSHEVGRTGADVVAALVVRRPDATLGLATGSSPVGVYDQLGARCDSGTLTLSEARGFLLDEYVGLPVDHAQRYRNVIQQDFVAKVDIDPSNVSSPDGAAADLPAACAAYEAAIEQGGGIDLQVLGLGADGHIGFNEPGSSLASRTRIKTLTRQTRQDNARFFGDDLDAVPHHCITQGVGTIMQARHLLMVVEGERKSAAVRQMIEGPVTARWPASALQLHPHVTVVLDPGAAAELELADYYRDVYAGKPTWQHW
ncbi:MAG: glucosamine-6-phosphate deaminase [Nocardioidaceae bacterium]|nr:glucosamine-6-phosphate deaminase [Nocardioidaceae bacterium]